MEAQVRVGGAKKWKVMSENVFLSFAVLYSFIRPSVTKTKKHKSVKSLFETK